MGKPRQHAIARFRTSWTTQLQRLLWLAAAGLTHADWHQTVVGFSARPRLGSSPSLDTLRVTWPVTGLAIDELALPTQSRPPQGTKADSRLEAKQAAPSSSAVSQT